MPAKDLLDFDFLFLIPMRNVDGTSSVSGLIKAQLGLEDEVPTKFIKAVLDGKNQQKTMLILDGYDEYTRGTNEHLDKFIESPTNKCFLLLTSRTGEYVSKAVRNQMDGEVVIEGFSKENIKKCSSLYLGSEDLSRDLLEQAKQSQICELLHVPIVLLMSCLVFTEKGSLPTTQTDLFGIVEELIMDRSTQKTMGKRSSELENLDSWLRVLSEMSWRALQSDVRQLMLDKVT